MKKNKFLSFLLPMLSICLVSNNFNNFNGVNNIINEKKSVSYNNVKSYDYVSYNDKSYSFVKKYSLNEFSDLKQLKQLGNGGGDYIHITRSPSTDSDSLLYSDYVCDKASVYELDFSLFDYFDNDDLIVFADSLSIGFDASLEGSYGIDDVLVGEAPVFSYNLAQRGYNSIINDKFPSVSYKTNFTTKKSSFAFTVEDLIRMSSEYNPVYLLTPYKDNAVANNFIYLFEPANIEDGTHTIHVEANTGVTVDSLKTLFRAEDVFGTPVDLTIESSDFKDEAGTYTVVYKAVDSWNNEATLTLTVVVTPYRTPTISLKDVSEDSTIYINYSSKFNKNDILNNFIKATDTDGTPIELSRIVWNKEFDNTQIGKTTYSLSVDSSKISGRKGTLDITIDIRQDMPPQIMAASDKVYTTSENPLTGEDFKLIVSALKDIPYANITEFAITNYDQYLSFQKRGKSCEVKYSLLNNGEKVTGVLSVNPIEKVEESFFDILNAHFSGYFNSHIAGPFAWSKMGTYLLYFVCFGWIWMPLVK